MSEFSQGFLSAPFDDIRSEVHKKYASWRDVLMNLNRECVAAQYCLTIHTGIPHETLGAALYMRTIATTQAAILLLERGLVPQAKAILRSALESLFALAAIEAKPELAVKLANTQDADRKALAEKALRWEGAALRASLLAHEDVSKLQEIAQLQTVSVNLWDLAKEAGMTDWYLSVYALLSHPVHANVSDLAAHHLVVDDQGTISALKSEPEVDEQEFVWAIAIEILIAAVKAVDGIFGVNSVDTKSHEAALSALVAQM